MTDNLTGTIHLVGDVNKVSDSFRKRDLVVTFMDGEYKQFVLLQATQDRCDLLNGLKEGDEVAVSYNLRGREWTNPKDGAVRYFNTLDLWKVEKVVAETTEPDDDLPF